MLNPISISFRFGMGPAWVNRIYDAETNPDNFFFSSHLSFIVVLNAAVNYCLSSRLTTRVSFNYNHISNGGLMQPNIGMNFPTLNAGFDYSLTEVSFPIRAKDTMQILYPDKSWWDVYILGTRKNVNNGEEKLYPVIGAGIYYNYHILRILALNAGTEWISDFSVKEKIRREYINDPGSAPYPARNKVYQRYGLNLRFTESLYMGINIKSHGHVADLMDARLGILF